LRCRAQGEVANQLTALRKAEQMTMETLQAEVENLKTELNSLKVEEESLTKERRENRQLYTEYLAELLKKQTEMKELSAIRREEVQQLKQDWEEANLGGLE
jgi:recombinational DNA repair protein (RecF pathway)